MRIHPFFPAISFKDHLASQSIYSYYIAADKIIVGERVLQIAFSVIEIPAAFTGAVRPPEDILAVIENVI